MKKLLTILTVIMLSLVACRNSFATLNAAIVWEVRTTGNAANGGGYKTGATGTDYSQQDAAQYSLTGVTTTAADAILLTASAAAVMVGNIANITGGTNFLTGRYEIISVVVGVSVTLDRTCTSAAGAGGTVEIGGATNHPNTISAVVIAGNTIYIKSGTYVKVGANAYVLSVSVAGSTASPITWEGYLTTRGDNPTGTDRPLFDGNSDTTNCIVVGYDKQRFYNIRAANATGDAFTGSFCSNAVDGGRFFVIKNSKISNNASDGMSHSLNTASCILTLIDSEVNNNSATGITVTSNNAVYTGYFSYIHDNSGIGVSSAGTNGTSIGCIYETNTGDGLSGIGGSGTGIEQPKVFNNVFYNNTGAGIDGLSLIGSGPVQIYNNSSTDNGAYGFTYAATQRWLYFDYNLYNGNGTAGLNNITAGSNDSTSAPSFNAAATGDFTASSSASPLVGAGFPQSVQGATGDYNWNIGVDQDDNTAGGASAYTFVGP